MLCLLLTSQMRKLFKMYDKTDTGRVHFEDVRMFGESFGMQLDDDSLLALYNVYDPQVGRAHKRKRGIILGALSLSLHPTCDDMSTYMALQLQLHHELDPLLV